MTTAKNQLSALLDRVRHGETILIEDRGIPVAQLAPVAAGSRAEADGRLARLERCGVIRPPVVSGKSKRALEPPPAGRRDVALSQRLVAERRDGR